MAYIEIVVWHEQTISKAFIVVFLLMYQGQVLQHNYIIIATFSYGFLQNSKKEGFA